MEYTFFNRWPKEGLRTSSAQQGHKGNPVGAPHPKLRPAWILMVPKPRGHTTDYQDGFLHRHWCRFLDYTFFDGWPKEGFFKLRASDRDPAPGHDNKGPELLRFSPWFSDDTPLTRGPGTLRRPCLQGFHNLFLFFGSADKRRPYPSFVAHLLLDDSTFGFNHDHDDQPLGSILRSLTLSSLSSLSPNFAAVRGNG